MSYDFTLRCSAPQLMSNSVNFDLLTDLKACDEWRRAQSGGLLLQLLWLGGTYLQPLAVLVDLWITRLRHSTPILTCRWISLLRSFVIPVK